MYIVNYFWFYYQTLEVWGKNYKKLWKWPKTITSMKRFKTLLFTSILYEIYFCFYFHDQNIKYMIGCYCWIPEIRDEIIKKHKMLKIFVGTNRTEKDNLYSDVVYVLRYSGSISVHILSSFKSICTLLIVVLWDEQ